ncbi:hypothetical protein AFGD_004954 [Aspergillus flavus]|nr:hypothetical protein AFGD_004954 [Aspergillus flavus]
MAEIPYLFIKSERTIKTTDWFPISPDPLGPTRIAWSDQLHTSKISVHRSCTSTSKRLLNDQVIIGRWGSSKSSLALPSSRSSGSKGSSSSSSGGGGGELPLPLWSLKFKSGSLNVVDLAEILRNTTDEGGDYNLLNRNCYWFAATAYASVRVFSSIEEPWSFRRWKGQLILFKNAAKPNAERFDQERKNKWEYAPGKPVSKWEFFERAYKETIRLEVDDEEEAKKQIEEHADEWINNDIDNNTSFSALPEWGSGKPFEDFEIDEVHEKVFDDGNAESYKKVYDRYNQAKPAPKPLPEDSEEISIPEELVVLEPTENQKQKMDQAIEVMVGRVLAEYEKNHPN